MLWGDSEVGKSFLAIDLACAVATGRSWLNLQTRRKPVIYVAAEGAYTLKRRVHAWLQHRQLSPNVLHPDEWRVMPWSPRLDRPEKRAATELAREIGAFTEGLIVIDTLAASSLGIDENTTKGLSPVIDNLLAMREQLRSTILVLHHAGWEPAADDKRARHERGSSAARGFVDLSMSVTVADPTGANAQSALRHLSCVKQRDFEKFDRRLYRMEECVWEPRGKFDRSLIIRSLPQPQSKIS